MSVVYRIWDANERLFLLSACIVTTNLYLSLSLFYYRSVVFKNPGCLLFPDAHFMFTVASETLPLTGVFAHPTVALFSTDRNCQNSRWFHAESKVFLLFLVQMFQSNFTKPVSMHFKFYLSCTS